MSTTPAGWYPDPEREGATRWWDGAQWAPSQDPAATDDRFKPRDESDAAAPTDADEPVLGDTFTPGAAAADWSPTAGNEWGPQATGQQPAAEPSWRTPAASAPSYGQESSTPSYGQPASTPAYGQEQPAWQQYGDAQQPTYGQPQYGQPGDASTANQWNQYGTQPKKSRTGLIIGIVAGALVLVLGLVIGGGFLVTNLIAGAQQNQSQTQGGSTGGGTGGGPGSFELSIPEDGSGVQTIDITTAGTYQIDVLSLNGEDPNVTLEGTGSSSFYAYDDDGGDGLDSQLVEDLEVGSYTLTVEEFTGDQLDVSVSITQL